MPNTTTLDPNEVIRTLEQLETRIEARFPKAGLAAVARALIGHARQSAAEAAALARPDFRMRLLLIGLVVVCGAGLLLVFRGFELHTDNHDLLSMIQAIDSALQILLVTGAAVFSLVTIEARLRRGRALAAIHKYRALVHVIDMHQLTKDPSVAISGATTTAASPKRDLTPFELSRYLDYCSEMLSLTAKIVALYALASSDAAVATAVNEIEQLTANLSHKIWQKIMIIQAGAAAPEA